MNGQRLARWMGALCAACIVAANLTPAARHALRLPASVEVAVGQAQNIVLDLPGRVAVRADAQTRGLLVDGAPAAARWRAMPGGALSLQPDRAGVYTLWLRLFGILPWRTLRVEAVPVADVVPGGQTVGIMIQARGPLVVGLVPLRDSRGTVPSPAARAGLRVGDYLLDMDGHRVRTEADVRAAVDAAGRAGVPLRATVERRGRTLAVDVSPVYTPAFGRYLIGARVRDTATGIGTLTFSARSGAYGALGHPVVDPTLGTPVLLGSGRLLPSIISGMQPSRDGRPGEKVGLLVGGVPPLGSVTANRALGVFGTLSRALPPGPETGALPVALPDQVHPGPAQLLTVLSGRQVQTFQMRITAVLPQRQPSAKGLVLRITDPRLLRATGGIVQGMSGSPILQDGRLVGAVTHVFVDDPSRGYGVYAEWMAQAAGLSADDRTPV